MKVTAAVLRELNKNLSVEELNLEAPKEKEVLVKIDAFGICHSDYHVVTGLAQQELPVVLGWGTTYYGGLSRISCGVSK